MAGYFILSKYPKELRDFFHLGAMYWMQVVQKAKEIGFGNLDMLTDFVFHMHHPELHGRPIYSGETGLANEWTGFRSVIKPTIDYTPRGHGSPSTPDVYKLLEDADLKALGGSTLELLSRFRLRILLLRENAGMKVDDRYWQYDFYDSRPGSGLHSSAQHQSWSVGGLVNRKEKRAIQEFERLAAGAATSVAAAKALAKVEANLFNNTSVVMKWAHERAGDMAPMKDAKEWLYVTEIYMLGVTRTEPESVYSVYREKIRKDYMNALSSSPSWSPWPVMPK